MDGAKGVTASASNVVNLGKLTATGDRHRLTLTLAASGSGKAIGTAYQATGTSTTSLVASINKGTSDTGISATINSAGSLILTQASADNIQMSGYAAGRAPALLRWRLEQRQRCGTQVKRPPRTRLCLHPGQRAARRRQRDLDHDRHRRWHPRETWSAGDQRVLPRWLTSMFRPSMARRRRTTGCYGTGNTNVSYDAALNTQGGANQAISVVNYALTSLNNTGGQLGAVQQGLTANINNLSTTSENVTSALGMVQDANLPQVANQLTQAQIQAQAGVAALKSSTTLQQSYLSLLP